MILLTNITKDKKRRLQFCEREKELISLKWLFFAINNTLLLKQSIINEKENKKSKFNDYFYIQTTLKKPTYSISRIRNQCRISGKNNAILRDFRMSRRSFKTEIKFTSRYVGLSNCNFSKLKTIKRHKIIKKTNVYCA